MKAKKKAKLAHEKREVTKRREGDGRFTFASVVGVVDDADMGQAAIVDLDGKGTMALVARWFVSQESETGEWHSGNSACPVMYDQVARAAAISAYASHQRKKPQEV